MRVTWGQQVLALVQCSCGPPPPFGRIEAPGEETTAGVLSVVLDGGWRREVRTTARMTGQVPSSVCRQRGGAGSWGFLSSVASPWEHPPTLFTHGKQTQRTRLGPVQGPVSSVPVATQARPIGEPATPQLDDVGLGSLLGEPGRNRSLGSPPPCGANSWTARMGRGSCPQPCRLRLSSDLLRWAAWASDLPPRGGAALSLAWRRTPGLWSHPPG